MISTKKYIIAPTTLLIAFTAFSYNLAVAQNKKTYNEEITVIAPYEPAISDAFKINRQPKVKDTMKVLPKMRYDITPKLTPLFPPSVPFSAINFVPDGIQNSKRFYVRGGAGNYGAAYGEFFAGSLPSARYMASVRLKHMSYSGKINAYASPQNSLNEIEVNAGKFFENHVLNGNLFYTRNVLHWYGMADSIKISNALIRQLFNNYGGNINFASQYKEKDNINHTIGLYANRLTSAHKANEIQLQLRASADKNFYVFGSGQAQNAGLKLEVNFLNQKDSLKSYTGTLASIQPFLKMKVHRIKLLLGVHVLNFKRDSINKFNFYPKAEASIELIPNNLILFGSFETGNIKQISLLNLYKENPFISPVWTMGYMHEHFNLHAGILSKVSKTINVNVFLSNVSIDNYPFFADNIANDKHTFSVVYDNINTSKIKGEAEFQQGDNLQIALSGTYNYYKTKKVQYAWYKPAIQAELFARYAFRKSLIFNIKATYNDKVWAPALTKNLADATAPTVLNPTQLKAWLDISMGAEFRYNKSLSFWINVNNMGNQQYFRWHNYPSYKLNVLGGASFSF